MAKEKRMKEIPTKDYFKEIISFLLIIFFLVTLAQIGLLGKYGFLLFKLLLGEWSFLIIVLIITSCIMYLIKGKGINIHSVNFQGFIFMYLAICLLSHLTVYEELGLTSKNVFKQTLILYKGYLSSYENSNYVGGGILGLILFQVSIILMGKAGVIILGIALIIMGISNMFNHSVVDFFKKIIKYVIYSSKFKNKILSYFKKMSIMHSDVEIRKKYPSISMLSDIKESSNIFLQKQINKTNCTNIDNLIKNNYPQANLINYYLGHTFSTIILKNASNELKRKVMEMTDAKISITNNDTTIIDVANKFKGLLTLKKALGDVDIKEIPIGLTPYNDYITLELENYNSFLIAGTKNSGVKTFIRGIITSIILIYKANFSLYLLDLRNEFKDHFTVSGAITYKNSLENISRSIDEIIIEYDRRMEILEYLNCNSFSNANKVINDENKKIDPIKPIFVILNTSLRALKSDSIDKINFISSQGLKVGIYIFVVTREVKELDLISIREYYKIIFKLNDISYAIKLCQNDIPCSMDGHGEMITINNQIVMHAQTPFTSISDYLKIINKFIF